MTKTHLNITIDTGVVETARRLFPNQISTKINDYLQSLIAYAQSDLLQIDKKKIKRELEEIESKQKNLSIKKDHLLSCLQNIEDQEKIRESEQLEKEKIQAEKKVMCSVCNIPKPNDKIIKFKGGIVCKGCFLDSANRDKLKQLHLGGKK